MIHFFTEQFERLASENEELIQFVLAEELKNDHLIGQLLSQLINTHHIWNCRLLGQMPDSEENDRMPSDFWIALNKDNHLQTIELLKFTDLNASIQWHGEEEISESVSSILQHIIKECVYARGRINQRMHELGVPYSSMKLVKTITW